MQVGVWADIKSQDFSIIDFAFACDYFLGKVGDGNGIGKDHLEHMYIHHRASVEPPIDLAAGKSALDRRRGARSPSGRGIDIWARAIRKG